ncbi:hypothetical protein VNO77_33413 [Canavalia gladiata]|uniref:Secreted protein n=1 Tax=Canavalia gladiata TaxID=3824 RepID=A0AAN9PYW0_CANGL
MALCLFIIFIFEVWRSHTHDVLKFFFCNTSPPVEWSQEKTISFHSNSESYFNQSNPCFGLHISPVDQSNPMIMNLTWHINIHETMHIVSLSPSSYPSILHPPACESAPH